MCFCNKQKDIDNLNGIIKDLKSELALYKEKYYESCSRYDKLNHGSYKQLQEQYDKYDELKKFSKEMGIKLMKYELFDVNEMINDKCGHSKCLEKDKE